MLPLPPDFLSEQDIKHMVWVNPWLARVDKTDKQYRKYFLFSLVKLD